MRRQYRAEAEAVQNGSFERGNTDEQRLHKTAVVRGPSAVIVSKRGVCSKSELRPHCGIINGIARQAESDSLQ